MRFPRSSASLEGFEAPAKAWETEILPARLKGYEPAWLDDQCLAGRSAWARLTPPAGANGGARHATPVRTTPITLVAPPGAALDVAPPASGRGPPERARAGRARLPRDPRRLVLRRTADAARLLRPQVEEALAELVALGLVTSDSFAACARCWCRPASASRSPARRGAGACSPSAWRAPAAGR